MLLPIAWLYKYINHWDESSVRGEESLGSARNFTGVFKSTDLCKNTDIYM